MQNIHKQRILILDFGSQYTQLIARRVRELGVYCELMPYYVDFESIKAFAPQGIIFSGGPSTVVHASTPRAPQAIFTMGVPVLGICYGMQTMAAQLGGSVERAEHREYGHAKLTVMMDIDLLADVADTNDVWMSHGDRVQQLPPGFSIIARSHNAPIAAMADLDRHFYGLQFHPEVTHTPLGAQILKHFVRDICGCAALWTPDNIIEDSIDKVRELVADDKIILGLSGGVDSSVVAALLHRAVGKQLICVFVDTGLLRLREAEQVMATFAEHMGLNIIHVDAADEFYQALAGVVDPEQKRKIIGKIFVDIFQREASKLPEAKWLAQGTIYPDVIESAGLGKDGGAHVIKSHHNVGGLPETLHLKLLEPLRELFKDEVRKVGEALGLAPSMVYRHPFPGPGLAVRILGEVTPGFAAILRQADAIFIEELRKENLYEKVSQAFAVFLPVKSVGVMGDARQYDHVIALRAVETIDFMTAHYAPLPHAFLGHVANRIVNEVQGISRVTYDISSKPPATIEWE